jgi:ectoine hydroxylase-related dioxygenase (phytanoyl-CoA dioxygenase family)
MSYVLGSHRWGKLFRPVSFSKPGEFHQAADTYDGEAPNIDADPERYPTVTFDLQPGDVVFHHLLTLHKAGANSTEGTRRRVHTIRFAGDGTKWVNRPFATFEFVNALREGDLLEGPDFPILWTAL